MIVNNNLKHKYMKILNIIILILVFTTLSCKAQHIIPVEKAVEYRNSNEGLLGDKDNVYVKDINNLLNKFIGTWKGNYNSKNYEFRVNKITNDRGQVKEDMLVMRYKIIKNSGDELVNTLNLENSDKYIIRGDYLAKTGSYVLNYIGINAECGQNGTIFISVTNNKMRLGLGVDGEMDSNCTTGPAEQILPTKGGMELIKQ